MKPQAITRLPDGRYIVDFGVNFTGREFFTLRNAAPGSAIIIRHGEMLREDGTLYTENLRSAAATTTYFAKGGFGVHGNVFDAQTLKNAQRQPEKYANLQVRVCGWNVRWNDIPRKEQDEYIRRAENLMK